MRLTLVVLAAAYAASAGLGAGVLLGTGAFSEDPGARQDGSRAPVVGSLQVGGPAAGPAAGPTTEPGPQGPTDERRTDRGGEARKGG